MDTDTKRERALAMFCEADLGKIRYSTKIVLQEPRGLQIWFYTLINLIYQRRRVFLLQYTFKLFACMQRKFVGKFNNPGDLSAIFYITLLLQMIGFGILRSFSSSPCLTSVLCSITRLFFFSVKWFHENMVGHDLQQKKELL